MLLFGDIKLGFPRGNVVVSIFCYNISSMSATQPLVSCFNITSEIQLDDFLCLTTFFCLHFASNFRSVNLETWGVLRSDIFGLFIVISFSSCQPQAYGLEQSVNCLPVCGDITKSAKSKYCFNAQFLHRFNKKIRKEFHVKL